MAKAQVINQALLDQVAATARESARKRKNYNFHGAEAELSHRLLNAMEPDSYIPPHRHQDATKDETILVLRGCLGAVFFNEAGEIGQTVLLEACGESLAVNIPHGVFHTLVALEPSVFFEAKAGPYEPLKAGEKAEWAPTEGAVDANVYLAELKRLFD